MMTTYSKICNNTKNNSKIITCYNKSIYTAFYSIIFFFIIECFCIL